MSKSDQENHSDQMNPNNDAYWESQGWEERPDDWEEHAQSGDETQSKAESSSTRNK